MIILTSMLPVRRFLDRMYSCCTLVQSSVCKEDYLCHVLLLADYIM